MKGIIIDSLFTKAHVRFYTHYANIVSGFSDIIILTPPNYYQKKALKKNIVLNELNILQIIGGKKKKNYNRKLNSIIYRCKALYNEIIIAIYLMGKEEDFIIVNGFEIITFALTLFLFPKRKIAIIHHNTIDAVSNNKINRWFFNTFKNRVHHIVAESFIKEFLVAKNGVHKELISVIPFPIDTMKVKSDEIVYDAVGLSNSNNEKFISTLIDMEKTTGIFQHNNIKLVFKSKTTTYDDGFLTVFEGFLDRQEFEKYFARAAFIVLPFPDTFQHRMSGNLLDAISNNKRVIASSIPVFLAYEVKNNKIIRCFDTPEKFINILLEGGKNMHCDFSEILKEHSNKKIEEAFRSLINNITEEIKD